jgi:hypothetical protein
VLTAIEKDGARRFCTTAYRLPHPKFDDVAVLMDRVTVFIGFRVIQRDGEIAD